MNKFVLFLPGLGDDLTLISLSLIIQYCPLDKPLTVANQVKMTLLYMQVHV